MLPVPLAPPKIPKHREANAGLPLPPWHPRWLRFFLVGYLLASLASTAAVYGIGMSLDVAFDVSGVAVLTTFGLLALCVCYCLTLFGWPAYRHIVTSGATMMPLVGLLGGGMVLMMFLGAMHARVSAEWRMDFKATADVLRIDGAIAASLPEQIAALPADYRPQRVALGRNGGGLVKGMMGAATQLRERGIDTVVIDGNCASSCAFLAMTFPKRLMTKDARLGFHDIRAVGNDREAAHFDRTKLTRSLVQLGYSAELIHELLSTDEIVWYQRDSSLKKNLATGCWDAAAVAEVPCGTPAPAAPSGP